MVIRVPSALFVSSGIDSGSGRLPHRRRNGQTIIESWRERFMCDIYK
jgi:hypothetical protein